MAVYTLSLLTLVLYERQLLTILTATSDWDYVSGAYYIMSPNVATLGEIMKFLCEPGCVGEVGDSKLEPEIIWGVGMKPEVSSNYWLDR